MTVLPSLGGAPSTRLGPRLARISTVIVQHYFTGILQMVGGDFGRVVVSCPLNDVLQAGTSSSSFLPAGIQDVFNLELFDSIDLYRRRRFLSLSRLRLIISRS